jgi:hypothetical protein
VIVDRAGTAFIALYDASRQKICAIEIDTTENGPATGTFHRPVTLTAGDHFICWGALNNSGRLRSAGVSTDVLKLMDVRAAAAGSETFMPDVLDENGAWDEKGIPLIHFD